MAAIWYNGYNIRSMDGIKSAREIAEEKVAEMGAPTEEERLRWKYVPEGEVLAGNSAAPTLRRSAIDVRRDLAKQFWADAVLGR